MCKGSAPHSAAGGVANNWMALPANHETPEVVRLELDWTALYQIDVMLTTVGNVSEHIRRLELLLESDPRFSVPRASVRSSSRLAIPV